MILAMQWMDGNLRARGIHSQRRNLVGDKGKIKYLPAAKKAFTIFGGLHEARSNRHAHNKYTQEVRRPPRHWCTEHMYAL